MTTLWADGFRDSNVANLAQSYGVTGTWVSDAGRRPGTVCVSHASASGAALVRSIPSAPSTIYFSLAFRPSGAIGTTKRSIIRVMEGSTVHISLAVGSGPDFGVYSGDVLTLLGSIPNFIIANTWVWVQVMVVIHDTAGIVEIRDGSGGVLLNLTGVDTRSAATGVVNALSFGCSGSSGITPISQDDLHIWDSTGSICNNFTNDTRIDSIYPDGAGDATQFTASAGANWQCVDEPSASAADYVDSATAGHQDLYTSTNLTHNPVSVFGVVRTAVASKDDAGARSIKLLSKSGATLNTGASQALTLGSDIRFADVLEVDPATSAAWTKPGLDALQIGFEAV